MYIYLCAHSKEKSGEQLVREFCRHYAREQGIVLSEEEIDNVPMVKGPNGKPGFDGFSDLHFSVSHSGNYWACAFSRAPLGFDIESVKHRIAGAKTPCETESRYRAVAKRFFTPEEYKYVLDGGVDAFLRIWVLKEAFVKCKGSGIASGLSRFCVIDRNRLAGRIEDTWCECVEILPDVKAAYCSIKKTDIDKIFFAQPEGMKEIFYGGKG